MKGRGKTNYLKNRLQDVKPLFVVDIRNEYSHIPVFRRFQEFISFLFHLQKLEGEDAISKYQYRFAFNGKKEYIKLFTLFESLKDATLVIDEADAIFSVRDFEKPLTNVFLGSRNNNVNIIFVGKRPFLIPIFIRSQIDEFVIFTTEEDRDIKYLESRLKKEFPKSPFRLERGEAILFNEGEKPQLIKVPKFKGEE